VATFGPARVTWGNNVSDAVILREFPVGKVFIPGNPVEHTEGGIPSDPYLMKGYDKKTS